MSASAVERLVAAGYQLTTSRKTTKAWPTGSGPDHRDLLLQVRRPDWDEGRALIYEAQLNPSMRPAVSAIEAMEECADRAVTWLLENFTGRQP